MRRIKRKPQFTLPTKYILLGMTVLCVTVMFLSFTFNLSGGPLNAVAGYVFVPMQKGINAVGGWMSEKADNLKNLNDVMQKNEELQAQVDELTAELNTIKLEQYDLDNYRALLELDDKYPSYKKVAANVIGKDSGNWFNTFIIDKGSKDGIEKDMNVIAGSGLVGIVTDVGPTWAKVRSIIDDSSNISAMAISTSDTCIVSGDMALMGTGQIAFSQMENNDNVVAVGDQIVTSYISDKYLQGILIGSVSEVNVDSNNLTRSGYITPAVDFKNIQEVLVITTTKAELTGENKTE